MYGTNITLPSNRMLSYNSALAKYNSIAPIRGRRDQNTRPLARRGNDNLTIRQDPDSKDIIVRLYSTDIIRYSSEGDGHNNLIELDPYASVLTNRIVTSILGPHVFTHWSDTNLITEVNGRYYHTPSFAVVQPAETGWTLVDGSKPISIPRLDRKAAKQALRDANYYTFKLWLETRIKLGVAEFGHRWGTKPFDWTPRTAMDYLVAGEEGWAEIASRMSNNIPLESELRSLREAVYQYEMCYTEDEVPYFTSYREMQSAINLIRRNG
jgi:hypothetical protein